MGGTQSDQSIMTLLSILTRSPPTGVARYWDEMLLFINDRGEVSIGTQICICSAEPSHGTEQCSQILAFKVATAVDHECVVDRGRLQADLDAGSPLAALITRVHQGTFIIDEATNRIVRLTKNGKTAADDLAQALVGYLRKDMKILPTKDWLLSENSDLEVLFNKYGINTSSSDADVAAAAVIIRMQAVNQGVYLRDNVEIGLREIVFEAFIEQD